LNKDINESEITVEISELKFKKTFRITGGKLDFDFTVKNLNLWSPKDPKLYDIKFTFNGEELTEKIGFRKIETSGKKIMLNGEQIFLRGISIHEEIPQDQRRAYSKEDATQLFGWVKDLHANMVRLVHYPHNENMTRMADSLGVMVWSEIPVYWTIEFDNKKVLEKAKIQLEEMILRDKNNASVIFGP
jgi:beta-glucuronidase